MNSAKFYGSKALKDKDRTEGDCPATSQPGGGPVRIEWSLLKPSTKLKTFTRQDEAIEYQCGDPELKVFAFEYAPGGVRKFLVGSAQVFWEHYTDNPYKHHYEVIPARCPCKLYLDLEYPIGKNPELDGNCMVDQLINALSTFIQSIFNIKVVKEDVLILDSTSNSKFSNHLIFNTVIFANNFDIGDFIKQFLQQLSSQDRQNFTISKGEGKQDWFLDTGVYTKNRNFRLFLSSKYGKQTRLGVSGHDLATVRMLENNHEVKSFQVEREIFLNSLVTNMPVGARILEYGESAAVHKKMEPKRSTSITSRPLSKSGSESPFVEVDGFVRKLVEPGFIRKWTYIQEGSLLVYEIGGTRYCGNIGRQHKSNNIRFICNLERGVVNQMCHDPDCSDYRSTGS